MSYSKILLLAGLISLSACSNAKESLGLSKSSPDEFQVVKRAPLSMPPDYSLRPPQPGAPRPQEQASVDAARQTVFGADSAQSSQAAAGGSAANILLQQAGATKADPSIRQLVDGESADVDNSKKPVVNRIMGLAGAGDTEGGVAVDPKKEAARLKKNAEEGKPVTAGETPNKDD